MPSRSPKAPSPTGVRYDQALTDRKVASLQKPGVFADGDGLSLHVLPSGSKSWRYRYRIDGRAGVAVLGTYPAMTLAAARRALQIARSDVAAGQKPLLRKLEQAVTAAAKVRDESLTLGAVTERWYETAAAEPETWSASTAAKTRGRIENHLRPTGLWHTPIKAVRVADLAALLDNLYGSQPDTAAKVRIILSGVFRFAAARGWANEDPVAATRPGSGLRKRRRKEGKLAAAVNLEELGSILRSVDMAKASWQVRGALHLMAYTAQRPGRVCAARWDEMHLDGDDPTWVIPRDLQKNRDASRGDHVVPLAAPVVTWLRTLPRNGEFIFATQNGHVTLEAPSKLLRVSLKLADRHTPHGFRSSFSTLANQQNAPDGRRRFDRDDIEHVLDHEIASEVVRAYDRSRSLPRLRAILEWWAEALALAKASA